MSTNLYRSFGPCTHIHRYEFFLTVNDEDIFFIAYCPDHFTLEHLFREVCKWAGIDRLNHIIEFQTIELQALHRSLRDIGCSNDSCEEDRVLLVLPSTQADSPHVLRNRTRRHLRRARKPNKIEPYRETECTSTSRLSRGFVRTKVTRRTTTVYGPGNIRITETVVYRRRRQPRDWDTWSPPPPATERQRSDSSSSESSTSSSRPTSPTSGGGIHASVDDGRVRPTSTSSRGQPSDTSGKDSSPIRGSAPLQPSVPHTSSPGTSTTPSEAQSGRPAPARPTTAQVLSELRPSRVPLPRNGL
jgi:hypothetical protein